MSGLFYKPPAADLQAQRREQPAFFTVAPNKLIVMLLLSFGFYTVYWMYKNWALYRDHSGRSLWPVPRAVFAIFYLPSLLYKIDGMSKSKGKGGLPHWWLSAALYFILPFSPYLIGCAIGLFCAVAGYDLPRFGFSVGFFIGAAAFVLQALVLLRVQRFINPLNGDSSGMENAAYSNLNRLWIVIGALNWCGINYWLWTTSASH